MNQLIRRALVVVPLLVFSWTLGCAGSAKKATVNGTVTFDNKPLKEGVVRFVPIDGQSQTTAANIASGRFTATVPVGEMRVEFTAPKLGKRLKAYDTPDSPVVDVPEELIPERFNIKSDLRITVREGTQDATFPLSGN
jgi:hypothetical protein